MTMDPFSGLGGNLFDNVFNRFFGGRDPFASARPSVERVDLSRLLSR